MMGGPHLLLRQPVQDAHLSSTSSGYSWSSTAGGMVRRLLQTQLFTPITAPAAPTVDWPQGGG